MLAVDCFDFEFHLQLVGTERNIDGRLCLQLSPIDQIGLIQM